MTPLAVLGLGLPTVPLSVAAVAGALSILHPCAFPLLPAYLASYAASRHGRKSGSRQRLAASYTSSSYT